MTAIGTAIGVLCVSILLCSSSILTSTLVSSTNILTLSTSNNPNAGQEELPPLIVSICDETDNPVENITVAVDQPFTLHSVVEGAVKPIMEYWFNSELIAIGSFLLDYSVPNPGEYTITLNVIDTAERNATDTILITVIGEEPTQSINEMIDDLISLIQTNGGFSHPCKMNMIIGMLQFCKHLAASDAINFIQHAIKPKLTGLKEDMCGNPWGNGFYRRPWVVDPVLQELYLQAINALLTALASEPESPANAKIDTLISLIQQNDGFASFMKRNIILMQLEQCKHLAPADAYNLVLNCIKPAITGPAEDAEGNHGNHGNGPHHHWGHGFHCHSWVIDPELRTLYLASVDEILLCLQSLSQ
jgi:hypothetical protein